MTSIVEEARRLRLVRSEQNLLRICQVITEKLSKGRLDFIERFARDMHHRITLARTHDELVAEFGNKTLSLAYQKFCLIEHIGDLRGLAFAVNKRGYLEMWVTDVEDSRKKRRYEEPLPPEYVGKVPEPIPSATPL